MKIRFIKEYVAVDPATNSGIIHRFGDTEEIEDYTAQWLIDNGFAVEVQESGWWKPKFGEMYFFLNSTGKIKVEPWLSDKSDEYRYSMGNCFKTKAATERYRDYLKADTTVRQDDGVLTPEQIRNEYYGSYIHYIGVDQFGQLSVDWKSLYDETTIASAIYFDTQDHAQASLNNHSNEWKIIANYDWSRE